MTLAFGLDDAYIALHSARVLLSGSDPVFNSPALTGATSPAYVVLIAVLLAAGCTPQLALWLASTAGLAAFIAGIWALAAAVRLRPSGRSVVLAVTLASGYVWLQATNGLETGWAMAAILWLIVSVLRGRLFTAAVLAGLVPALRPDLVPAAALLLVEAVRGEVNRRRRVFAVVAAAGVVLPFLVWLRLDTGGWLPATMRAKMLFFAEGCRPWSSRFALAGTGLAIVAVTLLPLAAGLLELARHRLGRAGLAAMAASLAAYFALLPGGLFHNSYRYPVAIVTPWCVLGFAWWLQRLSTRQANALTAVAITVAVLTFRVFPHGHREMASQLVEASAAVDSLVPAGATLLVHDAGAISELAHRPAVDLVGLKTPASIDAHARWTWPTCGGARGQAIAEAARRGHARYLMVSSGWNRLFGIEDGLKREGLVVTPIWVQSDGPYAYRLSSLWEAKTSPP